MKTQFKKKINLIRPSVTLGEFLPFLEDIFESGIFSSGKYNTLFAKELAKITASKFCHPCSSATTALWSCLKFLDIKEGDEVLVSDLSFPATANVVEDLGATPVFVDVNLDTFNMSLSELAAKINTKSKAVIFVDALGNPTGLKEIYQFCKSNKIPLIEDAACALGSYDNDLDFGPTADMSCFSFHPRKIICAGEGGAITTDSEELNNFLEIKLKHGARKTVSGEVIFEDFGYNFRISEIQAALAFVQIKKLQNIVAKRKDIWRQYCDFLLPLGFQAQKVGENVTYNVQSSCFVVPSNLNRDEFAKKLSNDGIDTSIGTYSMSASHYFKQKYCSIQPKAEFLMKNTISFPCYDGLDIDVVKKHILTAL